jgi:RsiW-degrading membrane proteinase PrsW (M82 family)
MKLHRRRDLWFLRYGCMLGLLVFFGGCMIFSAFVSAFLFANGPFVFLLAGLLATTTAVPYASILIWADRNESEPWYLLGTAFLWGAVVATAISLVVNTTAGVVAMNVVGNEAIAGQLTASFSAPFIEELTKGVAVMFLFMLFKRDFDNVLDGMLYGALVGLGFAWLENIHYYVQAASEGGTEGMLKLGLLRGVMNGLSSHASYTGLTGMGFGLVRVLRKGILRWTLVPIFWGMAMFAHFMWNTFVGVVIQATGAESEAGVLLLGIPVAIIVLQSPFMLLLAFAVGLSWLHEDRVIRRQLTAEPVEVVHPDEIARLVPARKRFFWSFLRFFGRGPIHWWHHRQLERDLVRLAFEKWHVENEPGLGWGIEEDADIHELRTAILHRRKKLAR